MSLKLHKACRPHLANHGQRHNDAAAESMEQKQPEDLVIAHANAVAHPRAVVIHTDHTSAATAAVMSTGWPNGFTLPAIAPIDQRPGACGEYIDHFLLDFGPLSLR